MTPFYEEIIYKNTTQQAHALIWDIINYSKIRRKYIKYKLLSKITWGGKRKRCKQKRQALKVKLRHIEQYF